MSTLRTTDSLSDTLTQLVLDTPGVTRLYPPVRAIPVVDSARRVLTGTIAPAPAIRVVVDDTDHTVTASLGIDTSRSARDIVEAACSAIESHLDQIPGVPMTIKITIAFVQP